MAVVVSKNFSARDSYDPTVFLAPPRNRPQMFAVTIIVKNFIFAE